MYLKGVDYPASKEDLVKQAKKNKAGDDVLSWLQGMSRKKFESPANVSKEAGK